MEVPCFQTNHDKTISLVGWPGAHEMLDLDLALQRCPRIQRELAVSDVCGVPRFR
jgi:hypothetical protein